MTKTQKATIQVVYNFLRFYHPCYYTELEHRRHLNRVARMLQNCGLIPDDKAGKKK